MKPDTERDSVRDSKRSTHQRTRSYEDDRAVTADRGSEFQRLFPELNGSQSVEDFSCAYQKVLLRQGRLYITQQHIAFYSVMATKFYIPFSEVEAIEKKVTLQLFHNAIQITTKNGDIHFFTSFIFRDQKTGNAAPRARVLPNIEPVGDDGESELSDDEGSAHSSSGGSADEEGDTVIVSPPTDMETNQTPDADVAASQDTTEPPSNTEGDTKEELTNDVSETLGGTLENPPVSQEQTQLDIHEQLGAPVVQNADEAFAKLPTDMSNEFSRTEEFAKKQLKIDVPLLGVTFNKVFERVLGDQSTFLTTYHEKRGDKDVQSSNWITSEQASWGGVREVRMTAEARGSFTPMIQHHRYAFITTPEGHKLLLWQQSSKTPEVTYGKSFRVEMLITFREKEGGLVMDAHAYICFVQSSMFKGLIESFAIPALQKSFEIMSDVIIQFCQPLTTTTIVPRVEIKEDAKAHKRRKTRSTRSPATRTPTALGPATFSSAAPLGTVEPTNVAAGTSDTSIRFLLLQITLLIMALLFLWGTSKTPSACTGYNLFEKLEHTSASLTSLTGSLQNATTSHLDRNSSDAAAALHKLLVEVLQRMDQVSTTAVPGKAAAAAAPSHTDLLAAIIAQQQRTSSYFLALATLCGLSLVVSLPALVYFYVSRPAA